MNRAFDYNGTIVAPSRPTKTLRTVKKVITIDSADRDGNKYLTNGDFVVYLPRVYENVVSIRLASAEFPPLYPVVVQATSPPTTSGGAVIHSYMNGPNVPSNIAGFTGDARILEPTPYYFIIEMDGLNKMDETAYLGNKSTFTDSFFAKIPCLANSGFLEYNDKGAQDNINKYSPPIGKLDRVHIRTRLHSQQGMQGFIYWTSDGFFIGHASNTITNFTLTLELEYLDNGFDEFSTLETRIHNTIETHARS